MSVYCCLLLVVLLCTGCCLANSMVFNVSLDKQDLANSNTQDVVFSGAVKVYCSEGMGQYLIYNLPEDKYNTCHEYPGAKVIGSCVNSPLHININKLAIAFSDLVSYEIGNTYYYAVYSSTNGKTLDNSPCMDGMKFSFNVVASFENEISPSSSATIDATPTSSYHDVISNTLSMSSPVLVSASSTTPTSLSSTSSSTPSLSTTIIASATPTSTTQPTVPSTMATQFDTDISDAVVDGIADSALSVAGSLWSLIVTLFLSSVILFTLL